MAGEWIKCPHCSALVPQGTSFCEVCGRRMPDRRMEPSVGFSREAPSASAPFSLQVAMPKAMQVGRCSLVGVRFRAETEIYESVEFVLRDGESEFDRVPCCSGRPQTAEHRSVLKVEPKTAGMAYIELDVICRVGIAGDTEVHTAAVQVDVDAPRQSAFNPIININQIQSSDRAGDTHGGNINVDFGGLQIQPAEDASRYETAMSDFRPLATSVRRSPARLTLKGGGCVMQIVSDRRMSFGRNRENLIALRVCGADGRVDWAANDENISRFHFRVECQGHECLILDGGSEAPSTFGTRVDGAQLAPHGERRLRPECDVLLGIGRPAIELKMKLRLFCDSCGRPSGLWLDRLDGARQRTYAVWRELPVGEGVKLVWNGSRWTLESETPSGAAAAAPCALAVGSFVSIGGRSYEILPFHQTHVD